MLRRTVPFTAAPLACISATTLISRRFTHHQPMATDAEKITPPKWDKTKGDEAALNAQTHHEAKRFTGEAGRYGASTAPGASTAATATSDTDTGGAAAAAGAGSTRLTTEDRDANRSDGSTRSDKEGKQMYEQMAEYDASDPKNQAAS